MVINTMTFNTFIKFSKTPAKATPKKLIDWSTKLICEFIKPNSFFDLTVLLIIALSAGIKNSSQIAAIVEKTSIKDKLYFVLLMVIVNKKT